MGFPIVRFCIKIIINATRKSPIATPVSSVFELSAIDHPNREDIDIVPEALLVCFVALHGF